MKIIYAGTPQYAVGPLRALHSSGEDIVAVITAPDKPTGRKAKLTPPPVKTCAEELKIPVLQFDKIRNHVDEIKSLGADIMITCAYGQILSDEILLSFPSGVWNLHASLLPKFRGASPIQSAILAGEPHTGVTVMRTERELDSGGILLVKRCETGDKTCGELSEELSRLSAEAALEAVKLLKAGSVQLLMQNESDATFCKKITKADAKINFSDSAVSICRLINAMNPAPAAFCMRGGEIFNIYKAEVCDFSAPGEVGEVISCDKKNGIIVKCGDGAVKIISAQPAGGKVLAAADIMNGRKLALGDRLE